VSKRTDEGYVTIGVEPYGGAIWHSWFDRDLSAAGRVLLSSAASNHVIHRLVDLEKPLFRIPTLAIHLDHTQNEAFKFNKETEYRPIAGLIEKQLNSVPSTPETDLGTSAIENRHHPELLSLLAETMSQSRETIKDFELILYDTQPPCLGGFNDEFIFAPRLDNLCMSFCAVKALEESKDVESDEALRLISLFDHEVLPLFWTYLTLGNWEFDCSWSGFEFPSDRLESVILPSLK